MILRELTEGDEAAFFVGLAEWTEAERRWYTFDWVPGVTFGEMLERLRKNTRGVDLRAGLVASTMMYGFAEEEGGAIVGRLHIRHVLNDFLRHRGGNIGYAVAARYRGKGYATEMFRQALPVCRGLGLKEVLVTCDEGNAASRRIIEGFGGKYENSVVEEETGELVRRYWIELV
jgi:predicted acetyltransferase